MSEEMRKHLRTQGKYSNKGGHSDEKGFKNRDKRQKISPTAKEPPEKKFQKRNSNGNKGAGNSSTDESTSPLKYEENCEYAFSELEEPKKPMEIKGRGKHILSKTDNGESMIFYEPRFMCEEEGNDYYDRFHNVTNWHEKNIVIHGVEYPQPRLVAWYGPFPYSYSGATLEPADMPDAVVEIKEKVEEYLAATGIDVKFNSVLLNLYRDGKDSVSWHSDDELTMGISPTIASVSLGETRKFEMRRKQKHYEEESSSDQMNQWLIHLTHGSLLIMTGCMQDDWQHRVPKEYHDKGARINLTFRTVHPLEKITSPMFRKRHFENTTWNETPHRKKMNFQCNEFLSSNNLRTSCPRTSTKSNDRIQSYRWSKFDVQNVSSREEATSNLHMNDTQKYISGHKRRFSGDTKRDCVANVTPGESSIPREYDSSELQNHLNCNIDSKQDRSLMSYAIALEKDVLKNILKLRNPEREDLEFLCDLMDGTHAERIQKLITKRMQSVIKFFDDTETNSEANITPEESVIPTEYDNLELQSLLSCNVDLMQGRSLMDYAFALRKKILKNILGNPEREELEFGCDLKDGTHAEKNQKLITKKMQSRIGKFSDDMRINCVANTSKESVLSSEYHRFRLDSLLKYNVDLMQGHSLMDYTFALRRRILENISDFRNSEKEDLLFLCDLTDATHTERNIKLITKRMQSVISSAVEKHQISDFQESSTVTSNL